MYNLQDILTRPVNFLNDEEFFISQWKETGIKFLNDYYNGEMPKYDIPLTEFIKEYCEVSGDFNQIILSGIEKLNKELYDEIPEKLGLNGNYGFVALNIFCKMLGIC